MVAWNQHTLTLQAFLDLLADNGGELRIDRGDGIVFIVMSLRGKQVKFGIDRTISVAHLRLAFGHALTDKVVEMANELTKTKAAAESPS